MFPYGLTLAALLNPCPDAVCLLWYLRCPEWDPANEKKIAGTPLTRVKQLHYVDLQMRPSTFK